ncbi:restriction endonuclease [Alteromonas gracilis]|uniref:restriction endonuclease n=1 Tax=Alteromonas gracilis TaxID=1479524 RepID=UPI0030D031CE
MEKTLSTWELFEDLVKRILEANNFQIDINSTRGDRGFDFLGQFGGESWAIEVKYYRTARVRPSLIESAAARVINNGIGRQTDKGMLVISSFLPGDIRLSLEEKFNIIFVDQIDLRNFAAAKPSLIDELDALLELGPEFIDKKSSSKRRLQDSGVKLSGTSSPPIDRKGTDLCEELKSLRRGRSTWSKYEDICERILKYLFPNDLQGWHKQKSTDGGANRYDFVCRVRPNTEYWRFIVDHLNSRYVVFEFKNYSEKIKQGQVLTTEKYLLERGLRKVAIMFTRLGADRNATSMMQGAMREHGKLILALDDETVCKMLHMKEQGEDPTDFLFELTDDFLLSLPR